MKSLKLGLIVLATILFLIGAYFITKPGKQFLASDESLPKIKLSFSASETNNLYNFDEKNNLTKALGQNLFEQIQADNLIDKENKILPVDINSAAEKLTKSVIDKSLANFKLVTTIYDSDIKISQDISKEAKSQYLKTLGEINQKNFGSFSENYLEVIVDTYQKIEPSSANRLAGIYKNMADDYSNLPVPADWVAIHKMMIIYAKNSGIVYQAMAYYPTDPLKGYLALETMDSLISNAEKIQTILEEKLKEIGS